MLEPIQITAVTVAVLSLYSYRADFSRYSIFTFGVFKRLDRVVVEDAEYECAEIHCETSTEVSERRRYYKEIVVAGMPLLPFDKGESYYCEDHVSFEALELLDNPKRTRSEKVGSSILVGLVAFLEWFAEPIEVEEDDAFEDVTASFGDVLSLIPVVLMVLLVASIIGAMQRSLPSEESELDRNL